MDSFFKDTLKLLICDRLMHVKQEKFNNMVYIECVLQ